MTLPELLLSRELRALGMDDQLRTWCAKGIVEPVIPGAYVRAADSHGLSKDDRYRLLVAATAQLFPHDVFSHESAAALWRLPSLGAWSASVHALAPRATGGRSKVRIRRHAIGMDPGSTSIDGVAVTSLIRTLADVACDRSFGRAVVMLDDAFRSPESGDFRSGTPPTKDSVLAVLESLGPVPGRARALRAIAFADPGSQSPGESLSRVQLLALGLPAPELQVELHDAAGRIGTVDFFWPELGLIGALLAARGLVARRFA